MGVHMRSTLRIWLVRHGQTLFNELGLSQGWCDSPLTDEGRLGLRALAEELRPIEWAGVYASTSERAVESAEIVTEGSREIVRDWRWKEYNFGVFEARPNEELVEAIREIAPSGDLFESFRGILGGDFPALERGETGAAYRGRVVAALADIRKSHSSGDVLVVTHGMTAGVVTTLVDPDFNVGFGMDNATFTLVEYGSDGSASIRAFGASSPSDLDARPLLPKS